MEHILLTGGAGFIGSHTFIALVNSGYQVTILDNFENSGRDVPERLEQITGKSVSVLDCDIRDEETLRCCFKKHEFDAVVHFAAKKSVPDGEADPLGYYRSNCTGLLNVLDAMVQHGVGKIVFSSSAAIYGTPPTVPTPEECAPEPLNTYARTKLFGEQILRATQDADDSFHVGVLRYFNPVGAHASSLIGENPRQTPTNLVPVLARVAMGQLDSVSVFGADYPTQDGTAVRDYIHVEDLAQGHVLSLSALMNDGKGHCVNLGTGRGYSVLEVIKAYEEASGVEIPYQVTERRAGDAAVSCAATKKAREKLGFQAQFGLAEMCKSNWMATQKLS